VTAAAPMFTAPTPLRVEGAGVCLDPGKTPDAIRVIIAEARVWGLLGIDLEWNEDGRITWVGLGHALNGRGRAVSFWWPGMPEEGRKLIAEAFADPLLPKLGQNGIQADRKVWEREVGPTGGTWEDTMLLHHAAYPGIAHDLQQIVAQFLVVPPWKAWRREAMRLAAQQRRDQVKADKKAAKQAAHQARNAERAADKERRKADKLAGREQKAADKAAASEAKKSAKQQAHEAKIAQQQAERERKKAEKQRAHEERNAASAAAAAERKNRRKNTDAPLLAPARPGRIVMPSDGAVVPKTSEPAARPPTTTDDEFPFDMLPANGLLCSVCGEPQRMGPMGETCANGHHGAPGVEGEPVAPAEVQPNEGFHMETPEEMGGQDERHGAVPAETCAKGHALPGGGQPCRVCELAAAVAAMPPLPAAEPPRTLLRPPVRPGGSLIENRVATLPPAAVRRLRVVITQPDGSEQEVEVPEE
jgi:hypothetical protein